MERFRPFFLITRTTAIFTIIYRFTRFIANSVSCQAISFIISKDSPVQLTDVFSDLFEMHSRLREVK
jgi:hypothetical protein